MKKKLLYGLCCAALFVGCTKDPDEVVVPQGEQIPIQLLGSIDQVAASRVNDEGFCNGDGIGVYVVNYQNGEPGTMLSEGNQADNVRYVLNEEENKWTPDYPIYYYDKVTPVDIIGYYPYVSNMDNVNAYSFELAKDQSTDAANGLMGGYEASDFLWGKAEKISPTASRVNITFNHKMAGVQVELTEGTGWGENEWVGLDKQVLVANTIRKATIDLATGTISPVGDVPTTGTIPAKNGNGWRAVVVPQSVGASVALFNITVDGVPYVFRKSEGFEYLSGKLHKFTIEVSKKEQSGLEFKLIGEAITAWESETITHDGTAREYVIINVPAASTDGSSALKAAIEASGKDYTKIKNLKITGEVNAYDFFFMRDEMGALQGVNMKEVETDVIPSYAFSNKASLVYFIFPKQTRMIGDYAFQGTNLTGTLIIPNSVTTIGHYAFSELRALYGQLVLPQCLQEIGERAFNGCDGLTGSLNIPNGTRHIGMYAFAYCRGFTGELYLPETLDRISPYAFMCCEYLTGSLRIPDKITTIEEGVFEACGFDGELILHDNITVISKRAFSGCNCKGELRLPKNISVIGEAAFYGATFSGSLVLPSSLNNIGDSAFIGCDRLTGIVDIPDNITMIPSNIFNGCTQLEGVVLHSNIDCIKSAAFANCYHINSIICDAIVPPVVETNAFNGVAKDHFVVEVPEASVADYTLAPNWNEFKRIAAHREFSINRNLFRTLNAEDSKTLILRAEAGAAWSVESCPDWVTVTPSSGVGKTEVVITVNEMADSDVAPFDVEVYDDWGSSTTQTYNGRSGKVVFLLDGKDYRSQTKVEQYDYTYGDGDVITNQTATIGNGVNIVFMGDCFDARDIANGSYLKGVNEAIGYYFDIEPYKTYKPYFNVYTVVGMSNDSGMGTVNTIRDAKFGSQYSLEGISPNHETTYEYAMKATTVNEDNLGQTLVVMIENTTEYGGICYMWGDGSAIACCPMSADAYPYDFRGIVQHEAGGHGFGKLGDEYIYYNSWLPSCLCYGGFLNGKALGWYRNLEDFGDMDKVGWSHLIFHPKYSNIVDVYEGGYTHTRGCFRSEPNSCMNNNIPYYSAISRQEMVERIMRYAGKLFDINEFYANDVLDMQGNIIGATRLSVEENAITLTGAGKQMPPKFMGDKPKLKKSNK